MIRTHSCLSMHMVVDTAAHNIKPCMPIGYCRQSGQDQVGHNMCGRCAVDEHSQHCTQKHERIGTHCLQLLLPSFLLISDAAKVGAHPW